MTLWGRKEKENIHQFCIVFALPHLLSNNHLKPYPTSLEPVKFTGKTEERLAEWLEAGKPSLPILAWLTSCSKIAASLPIGWLANHSQL